MEPRGKPQAKGRGAEGDPPNRFIATHLEETFEDREHDEDLLADRRVVPTEFLPDNSRTIIRENDSPDIPFRYSINAYRGCEHGCAYCYARPTHETLGLGAGLDFETKVLVKHDAAALLRHELGRSGWRCETIVMSGVTDCYQPAERRFSLTRALLEVMNEANQPVGIITKNALVLRDLDLLAPMAARRLAHVYLSVTTLDADLARSLEPRTSSPAAKLAAIRTLSDAGVPVGVMTAPIIPGLNDHETPAILAAAREAGARSAGYVLLRLPLNVEPVFRQWLATHLPDKQARIEGLIRSTRQGKLNESQFGRRMRGHGEYAAQIARNFTVFRRKHGLDQPLPELDCSQFRPPRSPSGQMMLF
ncbi:MAG TPA: PA0069 family radical SAM protein [Pirellulales bacterium]|nr:PA0069 family radical SAM protein [Pirellulales bacterium]